MLQKTSTRILLQKHLDKDTVYTGTSVIQCSNLPLAKDAVPIMGNSEIQTPLSQFARAPISHPLYHCNSLHTSDKKYFLNSSALDH